MSKFVIFYFLTMFGKKKHCLYTTLASAARYFSFYPRNPTDLYFAADFLQTSYHMAAKTNHTSLLCHMTKRKLTDPRRVLCLPKNKDVAACENRGSKQR